MIHIIVYSTTNTAANSWPGANRYYRFSGPDCQRPSNLTVTNVTTNSISVSWSDTAENHIVEYGTDVSGSNSNVRVTTAANSYTITGLNDATVYTIYISSLCHSGADTSWHSAISQRTHTNCIAFNPPYIDDFNSYSSSPYPDSLSGSIPPDCWAFRATGSNTSSDDLWPRIAPC